MILCEKKEKKNTKYRSKTNGAGQMKHTQNTSCPEPDQLTAKPTPNSLVPHIP